MHHFVNVCFTVASTQDFNFRSMRFQKPFFHPSFTSYSNSHKLFDYVSSYNFDQRFDQQLDNAQMVMKKSRKVVKKKYPCISCRKEEMVMKKLSVEVGEKMMVAAQMHMDAASQQVNSIKSLEKHILSQGNRNFNEILASTKAVKQLVSLKFLRTALFTRR